MDSSITDNMLYHKLTSIIARCASEKKSVIPIYFVIAESSGTPT